MRNLLAIVALLVCVTSLQGQSQPLVGQRVWVRSPKSSGALDKGVKGTVEGISGDSLQLRLESGSEVVSVELGEQDQLFVFTGRRRAPLRGALIGGGGGALVGLVLGLAAGEDCSKSHGWFCFDRGEMATAGALGLGAVGLVGGLVIGGLGHHDTWTRVAWLEGVRPVITPNPHGITVGLSLAF